MADRYKRDKTVKILMAPDKSSDKTIENLRAQDKRDKTIFFVLLISTNTVEILWTSDKRGSKGPS